MLSPVAKLSLFGRCVCVCLCERAQGTEMQVVIIAKLPAQPSWAVHSRWGRGKGCVLNICASRFASCIRTAVHMAEAISDNRTQKPKTVFVGNAPAGTDSGRHTNQQRL